MEIAVYCASANDLAEEYLAAARDLGRVLAERGHGLVYGGGSVGLMGEVARSVHRHAGHVTGFIPERLMAIEGRAYGKEDKLTVTDSMQDRKRGIFTLADAFLALPGGLGTMEEFMEVTTLRKLGYHNKPIGLINTGGFWDPLVDFLQQTEMKGFSPDLGSLFFVTPTPADAVDRIEREVHSLTISP